MLCATAWCRCVCHTAVRYCVKTDCTHRHTVKITSWCRDSDVTDLDENPVQSSATGAPYTRGGGDIVDDLE